MDCVVERLYAETIPRDKEPLARLIPNRKGEFAPQLFQAMHSPLFVKVQRDFAIRPRSKHVATLLEVFSNAFEVVEFPIRDDLQLAIFVRDGLVPTCEVDNTEA